MRLLVSFFLSLLSLSAYSADDKKEINFLSWADYIKPDILEEFEQETGIKVNVDYVDSHYSLESKIISTSNNYDVTIPTLAPFFLRQVQFGLFQPLDYSKLPNYKFIDPKVVEFEKNASNSDKYAIPFMVDTIGVGIDLNKINAIDPSADVQSLSLIFDPEIVKKFASCNIEILDSPEEVVGLALIYLGLDPNSESEDDLKKAFELLRKIRPYIASINNSIYFNNLSSGDACLVLGYSGDIVHARQLALANSNNHDIKYMLPKEGSILILDLMAISISSENKENAYKFLNFILRPDIIARIANSLGFTSPNKASYELIKKEYINNPNIYPLLHNHNNLHTLKVPSPSYNRLRNRMWMRFISDDWD